MSASDARALLLLCTLLPRGKREPQTAAEAAAPLAVAECQRIVGQLRHSGLPRLGGLLEVDREFWAATGLVPAEVERLCRLLAREEALDAELERLAERGIRAITRFDGEYPARLRERLRGQAPPLLFGVGAWSLLARPGLAVVGSRGVDEDGAAFTRRVAGRCAQDGLVVVTGGARGVDRVAMEAALETGGAVVGVLAGDLERTARLRDVGQWLELGRLLLLSPHHPRVGFSVAAAMERNKVVYALAEYGLVVASAHGQGGTWAGAREVQRHGWVPLFVRDEPGVPEGNRELLRPGALPFPPLEALGSEPLPAWLSRQGASARPAPQLAAEMPGDLFAIVWPHIAAFLHTPRRLDEIAAAFHLRLEQAEAWLLHAEAQGQVGVEEGPDRRYSV